MYEIHPLDGRFAGMTMYEILDRSDLTEYQKMEIVREHARRERNKTIVAWFKRTAGKIKKHFAAKKGSAGKPVAARHA